jgi:sugar lactone lactonase YvrE
MRNLLRFGAAAFGFAYAIGVWAAPPTKSGPIIYASASGSTSRDGAVYAVTPATGVKVAADNVGQPWKIALDANGNLFVADVAGDNGDPIWILPKGGDLDLYYLFPSTRASPYGVALGSSGTLYVTASTVEDGSASAIFAISGQGGTATQFSNSVGGQQYSLAHTVGGDFYSAGHYFSTDRVWKATAAGLAEVLIDGIPNTAADVQVGPDNALYIAVPGNNQILRWDLGSITPALSVFVDIPQPQSLAFDSAGYLYVGQHGSISRVDRLGNVVLLATGFRGDWITGLALDCPAGRKPATKACFSSKKPLIGP